MKNKKGPYRLWFEPFTNLTLEEMMFERYEDLIDLKRNIKKSNQKLYAYLRKSRPNLLKRMEELLEKGEQMPVKEICPYCKKRPIECISVRGRGADGYSISPSNTSCAACYDQYVETEGSYVLKPAFSEMLTFMRKTDRQQFLNVLKWVLGFSGPITAENCYRFFFEEEDKEEKQKDFPLLILPTQRKIIQTELF